MSSISCLQDIRQKFRSVLVEATVKLDELVKKIGKAVEDSKPYWEARRVARQVSSPALPITPPRAMGAPLTRGPPAEAQGHGTAMALSTGAFGVSPLFTSPPQVAFTPALGTISRVSVLAFGCPYQWALPYCWNWYPGPPPRRPDQRQCLERWACPLPP